MNEYRQMGIKESGIYFFPLCPDFHEVFKRRASYLRRYVTKLMQKWTLYFHDLPFRYIFFLARKNIPSHRLGVHTFFEKLFYLWRFFFSSHVWVPYKLESYSDDGVFRPAGLRRSKLYHFYSWKLVGAGVGLC